MESLPALVPARAVELVKAWEGLHRVGPDGLVYAYICPAGYPTQGFGIRVPSLDVPPITPEEAHRRLIGRLEAFSAEVAPLVHPSLYASPERLSGVLSWVFNLGTANLRASTFRRRLAVADWGGAAQECRRWVYATVGGEKRRLRGLVLRREMEAALIAG